MNFGILDFNLLSKSFSCCKNAKKMNEIHVSLIMKPRYNIELWKNVFSAVVKMQNKINVSLILKPRKLFGSNFRRFYDFVPCVPGSV